MRNPSARPFVILSVIGLLAGCATTPPAPKWRQGLTLLSADVPADSSIDWLAHINPNSQPFSTRTELEFTVFDSTVVTIILLDVTATRQDTLVHEPLSEGIYHLEYSLDSTYKSGVYFIQLITDSHRETKKAFYLR